MDRDRFVLFNGHGSMLIYSKLHLTGYDLSIDELKNFRKLHSKTPGHPEVDVTPGIETTTGPLFLQSDHFYDYNAKILDHKHCLQMVLANALIHNQNILTYLLASELLLHLEVRLVYVCFCIHL